MRTQPAIRSLAAGACLLLAFAAAAEAPAHEDPPILSADRLLPDDLLRGPHHRVVEEVSNDGFLNTYTIESDYGVFTARGDDLLRVRVQEVAALAALSEVTKSEAFTQAVAAAARRPIEAAAHVVDQPVETLKGLPSGVGRYFKRTARKVKKTARDVDEYLDEQKEKSEAAEAQPATEDSPAAAPGDAGAEATGGEEESNLEKTQEVAGKATKRFLGVGRSMREWAQKLGVDPYTTNETLRRELERVASAASVGSFGVRLATPGLGAIGTLGEVNELVWTTSAADLEVLNVKRLKELGLATDEIEAFLDNPAWSPSRLTGLVAALHGMSGVEGRGALAFLASAAESEEEAFFFQRSAEMLSLYHREVAPVRQILAGEVWGGGVTAGGTFAMVLALDYLAWTEDAATAFGVAAERFLPQPGVERFELWLAGRASPRARTELGKLGCTVEEGGRERWLEQ